MKDKKKSNCPIFKLWKGAWGEFAEQRKMVNFAWFTIMAVWAQMP